MDIYHVGQEGLKAFSDGLNVADQWMCDVFNKTSCQAIDHGEDEMDVDEEESEQADDGLEVTNVLAGPTANEISKVSCLLDSDTSKEMTMMGMKRSGCQTRLGRPQLFEEDRGTEGQGTEGKYSRLNHWVGFDGDSARSRLEDECSCCGHWEEIDGDPPTLILEVHMELCLVSVRQDFYSAR